jgi:hypothetical protein
MSKAALVPPLALLLVFVAASISGQEPPIPSNIQISTTTMQLQNEEQVFYCPTDENIIIATWRDFRLGYRRCGIGRSTDGGTTWSDFLNPLLIQVDYWQSDPTMTVDRFGNFYCSFLDFDPNYPTNDPDYSFISFIRSTDKGANWDGPVAVVPQHGPWFEDKQFITCDRTGGPYDGNVYVSWTRFPNPTRILFARSTDGAQIFEDTLTVGPIFYHEPCHNWQSSGQFSQPIVGSDGAVYVFWSGYHFLDDQCFAYSAMKMSKSTDGGQTWPIVDQTITLYSMGSYTYVDGGINVYSCPAGDADISGGTYDGNIYISFLDWVLESPQHSDIYLIKSTDGGTTWLPRIRVNDDPERLEYDQFLPWLIVNEDGVIVIIFYDQRLDPGHYQFDVFAAYSFDGAETFTMNHRLTEISSSPSYLATKAERPFVENQSPGDPQLQNPVSVMAGLIAEYIGVTAHHDNVTAVWTDTRNFNQDVFAASYVIPFMKPRLYYISDGGFVSSIPDSLYWSTCWHEDDDAYRLEIATDAGFSSLEVEVDLSDNKYNTASLSLPDGDYYWRVKAFRISEDDSTAYSDTWSFTVDADIPSAATLLSPADNNIVYDTMPTFIWNITKASPEYFELEISADPLFSGDPPYFHYDGIPDHNFTMTDPLPAEGVYYWRVNHYDLAGNETGYTEAESFEFLGYVCGDANRDTNVNIGDVVYITNHVFRNAECATNPPIGCAPEPYEAGDVNCDESVNIGDAVYLGNVIFRPGSPLPCAACP